MPECCVLLLYTRVGLKVCLSVKVFHDLFIIISVIIGIASIVIVIISIIIVIVILIHMRIMRKPSYHCHHHHHHHNHQKYRVIIEMVARHIKVKSFLFGEKVLPTLLPHLGGSYRIWLARHSQEWTGGELIR